MESKTEEKIVLDHIPTNTEYKDDQIITTSFTHKINPLTVDDLIVNGSADIEYADMVATHIKNHRKNFSQQQIDFSYTTSKLVTGTLKENKPVLVPVRCGFGKSTFINTILLTKIENFLNHQKFLNSLGTIIVTERLEDLKKIRDTIRENFGYYNHYQYDDKEGKFTDIKVDWMYVMEGWNPDIPCRLHINSYAESQESCDTCEFRAECKIGKQSTDQLYSPIIGITSARFYYYADAGTTFRIANWISKGTKLNRNLLFIDEKPKLSKIENVSDKTINDLNDAVSRVDEQNSHEIRSEKQLLKKELDNVKSVLSEIVLKFQKYRNAYVKINQSVFTDDFLKIWKRLFGYKHKKEIDAIIDMFTNGAIFCKTGTYDIFKTISMANFKVQDFKTIIFDGTAELSLEYDIKDFNIMKVEDFREYANVTFHSIKANYSKTNLKKNLEMLSPVIKWINANVNKPTFVVTNKLASEFLYDELKNNENVISYVGSNGKPCVPYFGFTKGMNTFKKCSQMIQIGWNRWDSDSYIAYRIATSRLIKEKFDEKYNEKFDTIQNLLRNENGRFAFSDIEMYKLMQLINDFEQEVFRTKVREFANSEPVDIFIFNCNKTMQMMIEQRFINCKFIYEKWAEIEEYNLRKRKSAENILVLKLEDWINQWDGSYKSISELREELEITENYWKKIKKKGPVQKAWNERNIIVKKHEKKYCLVTEAYLTKGTKN